MTTDSASARRSEPNVTYDFSGKAVLVTGGSQGIGLAIAEAFASCKATVHITGTRSGAGAYDSDVSRFVYHQARLERRSDRLSLIESIAGLDVLINNAGAARDDEYDFKGYEQTIDLNLNAAAELCFGFGRTLAERKGSVVNIGSVASFIAMGAYPAYAAAKAGLLGLTRRSPISGHAIRSASI